MKARLSILLFQFGPLVTALAIKMEHVVMMVTQIWTMRNGKDLSETSNDVRDQHEKQNAQ